MIIFKRTVLAPPASNTRLLWACGVEATLLLEAAILQTQVAATNRAARNGSYAQADVPSGPKTDTAALLKESTSSLNVAGMHPKSTFLYELTAAKRSHLLPAPGLLVWVRTLELGGASRVAMAGK